MGARLIKHAKVSGRSDGSDSAAVQPSDWNAEHTITWGPSFSAYRNTSNQTLANNSFTEVVFNAELWDTDSAYDTTNGRFTPQVAGKYQINASVTIQSDQTDLLNVQVNIYKNGTLYKRGQIHFVTTAIHSLVDLTVGGQVDLNGSTDYVTIAVYVSRTTGPTYVLAAGAPTQAWFDGYFVRT